MSPSNECFTRVCFHSPQHKIKPNLRVWFQGGYNKASEGQDQERSTDTTIKKQFKDFLTSKIQILFKIYELGVYIEFDK